MHKNAADCVMARRAFLVPPASHLMRDADRPRLLSLKREFRRVVQHENEAVACRKAIMGRLKVTRQYVFFAHTFIREKAVSRLGVRPILTSQRDALAHSIADLNK